VRFVADLNATPSRATAIQVASDNPYIAMIESRTDLSPAPAAVSRAALAPPASVVVSSIHSLPWRDRMTNRLLKMLVASALLTLTLVGGAASAQPSIACNFDGQEGHVDRGRGGYEVWYCIGGDWYFSHTCNNDGTCNPIEP